jgi:PAS domain S-box-containing protein
VRLRQLASSPLGRYGLAVLSTALALLLQKAFGRFIYPTPFLLFFGAVMLSGWWGGGGPGVLSIGLSVLAVAYYVLPPVHSLELQPGSEIPLGLFSLISAGMTRLNVALRRTSAERAELLARERLARRETEIERARLHDLFIQAPAIVALFQGPEHVYILSNPLCDEALGHRQVLGKPVREATPEAERQGFVALLDRVYATGVPFLTQEMPLKFLQADGTEREHFINFVCQPTRDAQGRIDGVATFGFDVTDFVRARQKTEALTAELKRTEERYLSFVNQSTEGIFRVDATHPFSVTLPVEEQIQIMLRDAYIVECNDAMARMYGFDNAAVFMGARMDKFLTQDDPRNFEALRAFIQRGYRRVDLESHEMARDGTSRIFLNNLVGIIERGQFIGAWGSQRDVTEQRHAEEELKRAESHARFLSEASAVLASSLDYESTLRNVARLAVPTLADWCVVDLAQPEGTFKRVETVSSSPEEADLVRQVHQFGNTSAANPRSPAVQAFSSAKALLIENVTPERLQQMAQSEEHARLLAALRAVSYIAVPMTVRGHAVGVLHFFTSHSGRRYTLEELSLLEDLARRAALSVENARLYREAQEAIRLRDEFLSVASHELKTPLTPLNLKLQLLAREARRQPDSPFRRAVEDYIAIGTRQVKKLSELVSDLLDVARIAGGRLRLESEGVDLGPLAREVVTRHEPEAVRVGSTLVLEAQESLVGYWDRLRLEQVITNLVDNAIKYGAGKPIHIQLEAEASRALLRVRDEGIGIAPEKLSRIFERFERAVSDRHYGGLGLGLYITRTIVEAMGGSIQVESTLGQGATFTVVLPRQPRDIPPSPPSA